MSKAYTFSFSEIKEIPVFNIFDNFEYYKNEPINDLSLYIIKSKNMNLFFNKNYNLCYGKYLKHFDNLEIVAVKTPSFIKQVNYKEIVDTLYNETISDNTVEDLHIKKNIANVNIGLLEKVVIKMLKVLFILHWKKLNIIKIFLVATFLQFKRSKKKKNTLKNGSKLILEMNN